MYIILIEKSGQNTMHNIIDKDDKMSKIGILTFHYSNNYGGVLQAEALYKTIVSLGYQAEIINYIPTSYKPQNILRNLGKRRILYELKTPLNFFKKIRIMNKYNKNITHKFNEYRQKNMKLSKQVNEDSLYSILNNYSKIIVGSDQVWNPSQRTSPIYFLDFKDKYSGYKYSYAADSTISTIDKNDKERIENSLSEFKSISVRNEHSKDFVEALLNKTPLIVSDPTLLYDFGSKKDNSVDTLENIKTSYILVYTLGEEIVGTNFEAIRMIKNKYPNYKVYSIKSTSRSFDLDTVSDKVFYDLDPSEWINLIKNASFMFTDSFHGVLFSLKYQIPFLSYYTEELRASRFIDLSKRYKIDTFIVQNVSEIGKKKSIEFTPDFNDIHEIIDKQNALSIDFLKDNLGN